MYVRTPEFDAAIPFSHKPIFRADVLLGGVVRQSDVPVSGGDIDVDGTAAVRRRLSRLIIADKALVPKYADDLLSPYGQEVRIWRGLRLPGGDVYLPVGTFRISEPRSTLGGRGMLVQVSGMDRARSVQMHRFEVPYTVPAGTNVGTAIQSLVTDRLPGTTCNFVTTTSTTPLVVFDQQADPWQAAQKMATDIGCELFFDPMGVCVLRAISDPGATGVDWDFSAEGKQTITTIESVYSTDPGYNGAVVMGEAPAVALTPSIVYDTDPASPTYSGGPYGKVPEFYRSNLITTQAQSDAAALGMRLRQRGATEVVSFSAIPHPALEAGDVGHVAEDRVRIDGNYLIDAFNMPIDVESEMHVTCRKRQAA